MLVKEALNVIFRYLHKYREDSPIKGSTGVAD